jgi:hypothetical protein
LRRNKVFGFLSFIYSIDIYSTPFSEGGFVSTEDAASLEMQHLAFVALSQRTGQSFMNENE